MFRMRVALHKPLLKSRLVWLALWVFSLSALMPTISAWLMSARASADAPWIEVCSVQGPKWVRALGNQPPDEGSGHVYGGKGHCPFCLLQDHSPVLPVTPVSLAVMSAPQSALLPMLFLRSPRTLHVWSPAAARAPPLSA